MSKSFHILHLEDNPVDADLVRFELQEAGLTFTSKVVMTERDFIRELLDFPPDLILSDYDLPRYNGASALGEAKKRCPDTPFILVTGAVTEDRAIDILTQGAKDYVLKNRLQQRLVPAVQRALMEAEEHKERKNAELELRAALLYSRTLIEASLDPLVTISTDGKIMDVNKAAKEIRGLSRDQIIGSDFSDYFTEPEKARAGYEKVFLEGSVKDYPLAICHDKGRVRKVLYNATIYKDERGEVQGVFAAARDVTELKNAEEKLRKAHGVLEEMVRITAAELQAEIAARKKTEEALQESEKRCRFITGTTVEVLRIINDALPLAIKIDRILNVIKRETGFEAVGIRLRSGNDYPYFVQNGFSDDFVLAENKLIIRAQEGGLCGDKDGNISLECTCGLVISGQTDPTNPLFTQGGSFWINDSLPLLDLPADQDPRINPRNRCIHEGYRSVAMIPIRANRNIIGLLQLNDRKENCFTLDLITYFEGLASGIGMALTCKQAEDIINKRTPDAILV